MPTVGQLRDKLIGKLKELFQLDQPDLDFGFYRIMHAKSKEVNGFLSDTLPGIIEESFGGMTAGKQTELQQAYENAVKMAKDFGAPDPENTEPVKKARAAWDAVKNTADEEAEVYDHLYRFFERYYDNGDFVSLRYLTRETDHKAKPYAIPYGGEEVMLHWANRDQYYIKTAEYFSNFTFDLSAAANKVRDSKNELFNHIPEGLKVHFRIVEADEGVHGNIKASDKDKRFFILSAENPAELIDGELYLNFEYRLDAEKIGQDGTWQEKRRQEAITKILQLEHNGKIGEFLELLAIKMPTDKNPERTLLEKYLAQYMSRNTSDYFIHKDLGTFLKRELDFYIKNEIMELDNIENAPSGAVEGYLTKLRVLRRIATKLIDFLAQLEDFQKKLWLKKKFVTQCDYCITLDRVPAAFYNEIAKNFEQWREWAKLGLMDVEFGGGYSWKDAPADCTDITVHFHDNPKLGYGYNFQADTWIEDCDLNPVGRNGELELTSLIPSGSLLSSHPYLMLDTKFFDADFKAKLLAAIPDIDAQTDGLLIHSENFQALNLLQERYREQVKCIYIDPPYNTGGDGFIYRDNYQHSSWLSMSVDRIKSALKLIHTQGVFFTSIDENEVNVYSIVCKEIFPYSLGIIAVKNNPKGRIFDKYFSTSHEYLLSFSISELGGMLVHTKTDEEIRTDYPLIDERGRHRLLELRNTHREFGKFNRPKLFYPLYVRSDNSVMLTPSPDSTIILPLWDDGFEGCWTWGIELAGRETSKLIAKEINGKIKIYRKAYAKDDDGNDAVKQVKTIWDDKKYQTDKGQITLTNLFGDRLFASPKPPDYVLDIIKLINFDNLCTVLDYFAGSGTTGHAVINLNREDGGKRKYILVEMGDHFDNVLKPRIQKVVFAKEWKDGKPVEIDKPRNTQKTRKNSEEISLFSADAENFPLSVPSLVNNPYSGVSHCFKYMRLESYEDTLNNLIFTPEAAYHTNPELAEDYLLRYMLKVETQNSASLLNISAFANPFDYRLNVKKAGSDEQELIAVDLPETFHYLIGLRVRQMFAPQRFSAEFERLPDPELPSDQKTKLTLKGRLHLDADGKWLFRKIEGVMPKNRFTPHDGAVEKVLIIWRNLTGNLEEDNLVLDEFFKRECLNTLDSEFATIYVNGSNNLPNLRRAADTWKVRLIEEDFMTKMWENR